MLTADLVLARRRGVELRLVTLDDEAKRRALDLAEGLLLAARAHVGLPRAELDEALQSVRAEARDAKVRAGLAKLVEDRCAFEAEPDIDPGELRHALFEAATARRRELGPGERLDRDALLATFAEARSTTPEAIERLLFADLRSAHPLKAFEDTSPTMLLAEWERAQGQAVLLRAVKVTVTLDVPSPAALRALFHRLKFLRLLHRVLRDGDTVRLEIDGPFSLFEAVTRYGLQLALVLPALEACGPFELEADVRWGKERLPVTFKLGSRAEAKDATKAPALLDETRELLDALERATDAWSIEPCREILELPGIGLCVPDLVFTPRNTARAGKASTRKRAGKAKEEGPRVYLEVMGYWSRDAVWKRVELVNAGLAAPIVFAAGARLRVSEAVLEDDATAALYVYKGKMNPRAVLARVEALARRTG